MPRPPQPLLDYDSVVVTALRIIDAEGLDAFSLPRLAREMNVRAPSLYHHFQDKAAILRAVARSIVLETPRPRERSAATWMEFFVEQSLNFRRTVLRHANAAPVLLQFLPRDVFTEVYDAYAAFLTEIGIPLHLQVLIMDGMDKLTLGAALTEAIKPPSDRGEVFPHVHPDQEPVLYRAVIANEHSPEELWAEAIRAFLRGIVDENRRPLPAGGPVGG
ncbi:TetR family transcriptional regulator [Frankia sp. AgB1.9]|uniref:TetR family transcriptional regulator n=1 Tax=unclassified Frankia TaxID=2632575 RepID=UPI0019317271|nr:MULTISPECIES: TetR family transcriptional regulator [unclassified Frankia]MBL7487643.1 TetR family transcriptional regulator [Frankia sp. AgW1.1]MBL7550021.1 TetR family transcriptional regulator [Frankia sp. AgB1.9]MBL7621914.1 TetR family transcriptional regulator [Frankia sp. AgB1.8]